MANPRILSKAVDFHVSFVDFKILIWAALLLALLLFFAVNQLSHSQCKAPVMPALGGRGPGLMVPGRGGGGRRSSMYPGSSMGGGGGGGLIPPPPSSVINSRRHSSRSGDIGYFNFIIKPGSNNVRVSTLRCLLVHTVQLVATLELFCKNTVLLVTTMDINVKTPSYL